MDVETREEYQEHPGNEVFTVKSLREDIIVNMSLIAIIVIAIILSMLLLPHMYRGLTWDGT